MNAIIGCKTYDTEKAISLATHSTISSHQELFQTLEGDFFLWMHQICVEGQKVWPNELSRDVELVRASDSRLRCFQRIIPFTRAQALAWCVETQIPAVLRGYVLHCV